VDFRIFRISGFQDFRITGLQDIRISGRIQDIRISGFQAGSTISGFQDFTRFLRRDGLEAYQRFPGTGYQSSQIVSSASNHLG